MLILAYLLNLHMFNEEGAIVPTHLPQAQDLLHLPQPLQSFIMWLLRKAGRRRGRGEAASSSAKTMVKPSHNTPIHRGDIPNKNYGHGVHLC